jgi:hypothetical protein
MLIKSEMPEMLSGIVSSAGPIDCAPAGLRLGRGGLKQALGGMAVLAVAMVVLVVLADEAMGGGAVKTLLHTLGRG